MLQENFRNRFGVACDSNLDGRKKVRQRLYVRNSSREVRRVFEVDECLNRTLILEQNGEVQGQLVSFSVAEGISPRNVFAPSQAQQLSQVHVVTGTDHRLDFATILNIKS